MNEPRLVGRGERCGCDGELDGDAAVPVGILYRRDGGWGGGLLFLLFLLFAVIGRHLQYLSDSPSPNDHLYGTR